MGVLRSLENADDALTAAIGDVHGRADLLEALLASAETEADARGRALRVVFLGDLIDRGAESRRSVDLAIDALRRHPGSCVLLGNHEDYLERLFEDRLDEAEFRHWLSQGGAETLLSYGIGHPASAKAAAERLAETASDHRALLCGADIMVDDSRFAFVHAGIEPSRSLEDQTRHDCLWIRKPFHDHVGPLPRIIVHGHQPQKDDRPTATENRISLDTGAVYSDVLTALLVDPTEQRLDFLATDTRRRTNLIAPRVEDRGFGTALDGWRVNDAG